MAEHPRTDPDESAADLPPSTGNDAIDEAVRQYLSAPGATAGEQAVSLSAAHEVLSAVLDRSRSAADDGQSPIPDLPRPPSR